MLDGFAMLPSNRLANAAPRRSRRSRGFVHGLPALAVIGAVLSGACENPLAPVSCGPIPDQTIPVGKSVGLRVCFTDENGDRVSLSAKSSRSGVAVVVTSGSTVTVTGRSGGTATVTVTARDPGGLLGTVSFSVWVPAIVQLTDDCGYFPVWSPDGTRLAFLSKRHFVCAVGWGLDFGVYVMNADGSGENIATRGPGVLFRVAWSPDGSRLAYTNSAGGHYRIFVVNPDGSGETDLTNNIFHDSWPSWSPDGSRIVFESRRDGNSEIYAMNADGTGVKNLTNDPEWDGDPVWSPDGTRIAFSSHRDGNRQLYVMNANGTGATNLTGDMGFRVRGSLAWSPDGTRIAFEVQPDRRSRGEIYVMNADGSGATNLALGETPFSSWSPDGRKIAFHCTSKRICLLDLSEGRRR